MSDSPVPADDPAIGPDPGSVAGSSVEEGPGSAGRVGVEVVRHEERLRVGLERVPSERVRLVRRIVTETRLVEVRVRREVLEIERSTAADVLARAGEPGPYGFTDADAARGPVVIVLHEEVPMITVEVRAAERVRVDVRGVVVRVPVTAKLSAEQVVITGPPPGTRPDLI